MLSILLAAPIFTILLILQSAVITRIPLLHGAADLSLLAVVAWSLQKRVRTGLHWGVAAGLGLSIVSALPFGVALAAYPLAALLAGLLRRRVWQAPLLAMFVCTFLATLLVNFISLGALRLMGSSLPLLETFNQVILPSVLLNLLLAIPFYAMFADLANWLYPEELEV